MDWKIGSVFVAWLLGLLSPTIIEAIKRKYHRNDMRRVVLLELAELRIRLVTTTYQLKARAGELTHEFIEWCVNEGSSSTDERHQKVFEKMRGLLAKPAAELTGINAIKKQMERGSSINLKKIDLPYLESLMPNLALFDINFQRQLLQIRSYIQLLNQEIDQTRFYFQSTFNSSASPENTATLNKNLDESFNFLAGFSRTGVELINKVTSTPNQSLQPTSPSGRRG